MFDRILTRRGAAARVVAYPYAIVENLRRLVPSRGYGPADRQRDFRAVFDATPAGRRVLAQVLDRCHVCGRSFVAGDGLETARREGMRDVGLWMLEILAAENTHRPRSAEGEETSEPSEAAQHAAQA